MKPALSVAVLLAAPVWLEAQDAAKPFQYSGSGYVSFLGGMCQHKYGFTGVGGGGEAFLWRGLSLGGDLGYQSFIQDRPFRFGLAYVTVGYHFANRKRPNKVDPFLLYAPVGGAIVNGVWASGFLGGGANYWFRPRIGLRTEARVMVVAREEVLTTFGIGLSFR